MAKFYGKIEFQISDNTYYTNFYNSESEYNEVVEKHIYNAYAFEITKKEYDFMMSPYTRDLWEQQKSGIDFYHHGGLSFYVYGTSYKVYDLRSSKIPISTGNCLEGTLAKNIIKQWKPNDFQDIEIPDLGSNETWSAVRQHKVGAETYYSMKKNDGVSYSKHVIINNKQEVVSLKNESFRKEKFSLIDNLISNWSQEKCGFEVFELLGMSITEYNQWSGLKTSDTLKSVTFLQIEGTWSICSQTKIGEDYYYLMVKDGTDNQPENLIINDMKNVIEYKENTFITETEFIENVKSFVLFEDEYNKGVMSEGKTRAEQNSSNLAEDLNGLALMQVDGYYITSENQDYGLGYNPNADEDKQFAIYEQKERMTGFDTNGNQIMNYAFTNPTYFQNKTAADWYNFEQVYDLTPPTSKHSKLFGLIEAAPNTNFYYRIDIAHGDTIVEKLYFENEEKYIDKLKELEGVGRSSAVTSVPITRNEFVEHEMSQKIATQIPNLKQNAGYYILDETKDAAMGFSPTQPDKLVIWDRVPNGGYVSGHYGSTLNLLEANELLLRGFDMDKVTGILNNIGFDYDGVEKASPLSPVKSRFIQETKDLIGDVENLNLIDKRKFNSIEIPSYTDTWSTVGELQVGADTYYLMENDEWGDETQYLIIDEKQNLIVDDVYNGFEEPQFVEYLENIAVDEEYRQSQPPTVEPATVTLKSIVTQTYDSDPNTHRITATHTRTGAEVFEELKTELEAHGLLPDDYFLPNFEERFMLPEDAYFKVFTDFGESEGIYIDVTLIGGQNPQRFATGKTLDDTADMFMKMSRIGAISQLLLNGNGIEYELTQEKSIIPQKAAPVIDPSRKTIYVCSPLAGEIEANIHKAREYSKFVARQGGTPIAPHITELFDDSIPEERELGLAMGIDYLRKADELWVFGDVISNGMSAEIIIAQDELKIPMFHVDGETFSKVPFNEYTFPNEIVEETTKAVMQPILDEIAEYEADFDIPSFEVGSRNANEIIEHLAQIKTIIQRNRRDSYDEPFEPLDEGGYAVNVHNPYTDMTITVGYDEESPYIFSIDEYKAFQQLNESIKKDKLKEVLPVAENFTRDQLNRAKDVDLLNYVQTRGYTIKAHGSCYKLIEDGHDSTVIFPNTNSWSNMASGIGGDTVSFLVKHEGKDMVSAVKELIGETFDPQKMFVKSETAKASREPLVLPQPAQDNRRVYAYLLQTRGLDRDIVHDAIHAHSIYQSEEIIKKGDKEYTFNNCIFVGKDKDGVAKYASQRSMNDNTAFVFKQDVKNSDKAYGFLIEGKEAADWLTVCEAPIDALSIASLNKLKGQVNDDEHILSLGGVSDKSIDKFLEGNKNIKVINICLDNDEAGRTAGEKLKEKYSGLGFKVIESYPKEKDYNLELKKAIEIKNTPVADAPDKAENNRRTFMHLTQTKLIDENLVKARFADNSMYQSDRNVQRTDGENLKRSNTVFVQRNVNGSVIYAIEVGQNSGADKPDFKIEYRNESQAGNYLSQVGENNVLLVFNNPLSQLSYQTATNDVGVQPKANYLCCTTNQTEAVSEFLVKNPHIKNVQVMLDKAAVVSTSTNQLVDYREFAFKKIKKEIGSKGISVSKKYPQGIDWNKDMLAVKNASKAHEKAAATDKNKEQSDENER